MSSSDRVRRGPHSFALLCLAAAAAMAASGCTVRPLYGRTSAFVGAEPAPALADLKGRIEVAPVNDRTSQIVRNALLFGFNGGERPLAPFYKLSFTAVSLETVVSIQQGSGIPSASLLQLTVNYSVARTTDGVIVAGGKRFANAPFDRSRQLFAASRAYRDAQERAGREAAEQVRLAVLGALERDLPNLLASVPPGKP
jgi:LPS-assembly lipoprotein